MIKYTHYSIITVDDDKIYRNDTILTLYRYYIKYPNLVVARRVNKINYYQNGQIKPYIKFILQYEKIRIPSFDL